MRADTPVTTHGELNARRDVRFLLEISRCDTMALDIQLKEEEEEGGGREKKRGDRNAGEIVAPTYRLSLAGCVAVQLRSARPRRHRCDAPPLLDPSPAQLITQSHPSADGS